MVRHSKLVRKGAFELCHRMIGQLAMGKSKLVQLNIVWVVEKKLSLADHRKWNSDFFFIFGLKFSQPERFLFPFFRVMTVEFVNNHANVAIGDPSRPGRGRGKGLVQHCCHSGLWRVYWCKGAIPLPTCLKKKKKLKTCILIPTTGFQIFWNRH